MHVLEDKYIKDLRGEKVHLPSTFKKQKNVSLPPSKIKAINKRCAKQTQSQINFTISMNSTKVGGPSTIFIFVSDQRRKKSLKTLFGQQRVPKGNSIPSLLHQPKDTSRTAFQTCSHFIPIKDPFAPREYPKPKKSSPKTLQKEKKTSFHEILV